MATAEDNFRVEVWSDDEAHVVETISRSPDFIVSMAAWHAAVRQRPGALLLHYNQRFVMERMRTPGEKPATDRQSIDAALGDRRHWHRLRAWCTGCYNHRWIDAQDLKARFGGEMLFSEVEKKLKCKSAGCKGGNVRLEIHNAPRD